MSVAFPARTFSLVLNVARRNPKSQLKSSYTPFDPSTSSGQALHIPRQCFALLTARRVFMMLAMKAVVKLLSGLRRTRPGQLKNNGILPIAKRAP